MSSSAALMPFQANTGPGFSAASTLSMLIPQVEGDALAGLTLLLDLPPAQRREAEVLARRLGAEVGARTCLSVENAKVLK